MRDGDYYGTWVVVARRLCDDAQGGQILATELTKALSASRSEHPLRDLPSRRLKGIDDLVSPVEVLWEPITELPPQSEARILAVDDQPSNLSLLEQLLERNGFPNVESTSDARQALPLFLSFRPDLVLLDLQMPHLDGYEVLEQLQARVPPDTYLPILVLTADISPEAKKRCLAMGARDFLTKPFDPTEVLLRIKNLLEARSLHLELRDQNRRLEEKVAQRTHLLEDAQGQILDRLALVAGLRDDEAGTHARGVGDLAAEIVAATGAPASESEPYRRAAALHDIGKLGIPEAVLLKPGPLTEDEIEIVRTHTTIGTKILSGGTFPLLQLAEEIALTHHERWDGSGYAGLEGEGIPFSGRVVAIAEVFDTLINERPYKPAWSEDDALREIEAGRGSAFDPRLVDAFLASRRSRKA
jgi:putative two-component system response regulator